MTKHEIARHGMARGRQAARQPTRPEAKRAAVSAMQPRDSERAEHAAASISTSSRIEFVHINININIVWLSGLNDMVIVQHDDL